MEEQIHLAKDNEEFLKLFMCSCGESKIKIDKNRNLKAYKKRRSQTFENRLNNLKNNKINIIFNLNK